jgi:hypothetical protein
LDSDSESDLDSEPGLASGGQSFNDSSNAGEQDEVELEDFPEGSWDNIAEIIARAQGHNVRHEAAEVAQSSTPFNSHDEGVIYVRALRTALSLDEFPVGFNLDEEYQSSESYKTGRSSRPLVIALPYNVWFPRILVWCKALNLLKRLEVARDMID